MAREIEIRWKEQPRQLKFLRACGLSHPFDGGNPRRAVAEVVGYGGAAGGGKAQTLDSIVMTPFGPKKMKSIHVGSLVSNPDGSVSTVIQVHPQGIKPVYRVHFSDGSNALVSDEHLWLVKLAGKRQKAERYYEDGTSIRGRIKGTLQLKEYIDQQKKQKKPYWPIIPLSEPVPFTIPRNRYTKPLFDPYLVGLLLGDGTLTQGRIGLTSDDKELREYFRRVCGNTADHGITVWTRDKQMVDELKSIGIYGLTAANKHIPEKYLLSSLEDRKSILQGLMDTDGYVDKRGHCHFYSISLQLSQDVQWIARSLGAKATITRKEASYVNDEGNRIRCKDCYCVYIQSKRNHEFFRLPRKINRCTNQFNGGHSELGRRMIDIEYVGEKECQCITVDHPNGLYLTDDFIVTHNSDALLMAGLIACLSMPGIKVGYFRRKFTQLEGLGGAIMRSQEIIKPLGVARYNGSQHQWTFENGGFLRFCHLQDENTVFDYQSQQFDILLFDEATQFTRSQVRYMLTRNRATIDNFTPFAAMATNPGNIGHAWFKSEFVEIGKPEVPYSVEVEEGKYETHIFIPARLDDNLALEERDPGYRKKLENQPEIIRRQLLDGDWDVAEGVAFSEWRKPIHVIEPFLIPDEWIRFTALDWGYAKPFSVGWYAVDHDGRMYKYREIYGWNGKPDEGCKKDPEEVAKQMHEAENYLDVRGKKKKENIRYRVADDAIFGGRQDNSPSIAEQFADARIYWTPVGKGPKSRVSGKLEVHHRLKWFKDDEGDWDGERPMLVVFNNCTHTIRTVPNLILDEKSPEDVDTDLEDHAYDETRYACMSRPMAPPRKKEEKTKVQKHKERLAKRQRNRIRMI